MPDVLLFLIGLAVTASVFTAFALLIQAEIRDGRIADADAAGVDHELDETVAEHRAAKAEARYSKPAMRR